MVSLNLSYRAVDPCTLSILLVRRGHCLGDWFSLILANTTLNKKHRSWPCPLIRVTVHTIVFQISNNVFSMIHSGNLVTGHLHRGNVGNTNDPNGFATLALDGDPNTCCKTIPSNNHNDAYDYWWIQLKRKYFVSGVKLIIPESEKGNNDTSAIFCYLCWWRLYLVVNSISWYFAIHENESTELGVHFHALNVSNGRRKHM